MEEDDALELQDYLRGLHSRCKGGDVDWKAVMEGRSTLGGDRKGARGLELGGGLSASPQIEAKGGNRFLKGRNIVAKGSKERKSDSVSSKASSHFTKLSAKGFLKDNSLSPSASDRSRTSSSVSSLLSDDLLSEREDQPVARAAPLARASLHSDEYSLDSTEEETRPSVASDRSGPQPWRDKSSSSSPSTPSEVAVELPRVQFVSDMASLSSVIPDQVATADSVTEQLSSVATEVRHSEGVLRSGQGSMPGGEEGCYDDDTFEDVSVLDDGHVEHRPVSHQSDLVEHEYGDSDFEESIVESPNSSDEQTSTEDEECDDEVDDVEDDNDDGSDDDGSTESRDAFTETLGSAVVEQTKEVPSKRPLAKVRLCVCVCVCVCVCMRAMH